MTLVQFWTDEANHHEHAKTEAEQAIDRARGELAAARARRDAALQDIAAAQQAIARLRRELPRQDPPLVEADAQALRARIAELRDASGRRSFWSGAIAKAELDIEHAQAERDEHARELARARSALAQAEARVRASDAWFADASRTALRGPLAGLPDRASAKVAPGAAERLAAQQKLDQYFPSELKTAIDARRALGAAALTKLSEAADDARAHLAARLDQLGPEGKVERAVVAYEAAWGALAAFALGAEEQYDAALARYGLAAALPDAPAALQASMKTGALFTQGVAALGAEATRNTKVLEALDALLAVARARAAAGADDPRTIAASIEDEVELADAAKAGAFQAAADFRAGDKRKIDAWQAGLSDEAFRGLVAFQDADEALGRLKDVSAAGLVTAARQAEEALVQALADAAKAARATSFLRRTVAQRIDWLTQSSKVRDDNLFSLARGDG